MRRMNRMPETYFGRTNEEWYEEMRDVAHEEEKAMLAELRDAVQSLDSMRKSQEELERKISDLESTIYRLAVDGLKIVAEPVQWKPHQFRCAGFVVQVSQGEFGRRHVRLYQIGNLPEA